MIHVYWEDDCIFVELEIGPLFVLEGSGIDLASALRDLATQIEDWETEHGEVAA